MPLRLSAATKKRLIRYAKAVKQKETKVRREYFPDGSYGEVFDKLAIDEWYLARVALRRCPEPAIKKLVYQIHWKRLDDGLKGIHDALIAENELVALGHKLAALNK